MSYLVSNPFPGGVLSLPLLLEVLKSVASYMGGEGYNSYNSQQLEFFPGEMWCSC